MDAIMLMLVSMTLILMQGHSGYKAKAQNQRPMLSATKKAISVKLATTVGLFFFLFFFLPDLDFENVYKA